MESVITNSKPKPNTINCVAGEIEDDAIGTDY
jgi:hypothetical protein